MKTKTLTVEINGTKVYDLYYKGNHLKTIEKESMLDVETEATKLGFTHIKWKHIPIGKGTTRSKIGAW